MIKLTTLQRAKIWEILANHTFPKEQFGFFTMDMLIDLIEKAINTLDVTDDS